MRSPTAASLALKAALLSSASAYQFHPWGFQSGAFAPLTTSSDPHRAAAQSEMINDDSYAAAMYHDPTHNLVFVTGSTYGTYFDSSPEELDRDVKGAMGMSDLEGGRDVHHAHLPKSDCFLGILKLPRVVDGPEVPDGHVQGMGNPAPWLAREADGESSNQPQLIYARRFGTPQNAEACSSVLMLPQVHDALLRSPAQLKLALLGHVTPTPLSAAEAASSVALPAGASNADTDRGGFLHSLSGSPEEVETNEGRAYGFVADFDVSLTADETFAQAPDDTSFHNAYGALLGGAVLDGSALVYPVAMAQNKRDRNQLYVVSMHSENGAAVPNPDYHTTAREELDGTIHARADATLGGAGGDGARLVGGAPQYGSDFYVKVQQLSIVPSQELMNVEPTPDEQVKRTMTNGWGFGFKLNDADDVRPSAVAFVQGRTPDEDLLLLGGTTRKDGERDAFITKLLVPAPSPVADVTTGHTVEEALEDESVHPTKRIDSTTDRDETVTAICLPPPDLRSGAVEHAYVVGSSTKSNDPSVAYLLKLRLDDLSIEWKQHLPSIHPDGIGGDVLGEGCAVSPGGTTVYIGGTIDGGSALNPGADATVHPVGGKTDVFVVAYDGDFGHVKWARQLGTVAEDKLARGGGVSTDDRGNVILMGSTRGGLQRHREDVTKMLPEEGGQAHMASDVFVMSLSRLNGEYVNAPYTGDGNAPPVSTSGGVAEPSLLDQEAEEALETYEGGVGLSPGAIVGAAFVAIAVSAALLFLVARSLKARKRRLRATEPGDILRLWENEGGDDFSFSGRRILGGRRTSAMVPPIKGASSSDWDDTEGLGGSISRNASWMRSGGDDGSVHSAGSGKGSSSPKSASSPKSYTSDQTEKNLDFISTLRQEANASISKMIHKGDDDGATDDPRVDSGNSIKSLLTHYREKKKGGLVAEEGSPGTGKGKGTKSPPPPPPRKKKDGDAAQDSERDGLSEFTIV
ncbi:hypothetical protein ACHAXT_012539 [Thalassiosira profunda]